MRPPENNSQVFMSKTTAKTMRNLNQDYFGGVSSDKSFVQQSWLLIDGRRKEDNRYMHPSRKT